MVFELVAAGAGAVVLAKVMHKYGDIMYQECFDSAETEDDQMRVVVRTPVRSPPQETTPLLPPNSGPHSPAVIAASHLYAAHLKAISMHGSSSASSRSRRPSSSASSYFGGGRGHATSAMASGISTPARTPGASFSVGSTPASTAPSTPASGSYMREPLYVSDVSMALERESKRRASAVQTPEPWEMSGAPASFTFSKRKLSVSAESQGKVFTDETSYLTASLLCLLHCADLHDYFLSGRYLEEDIENAEHQAVVNAFASTAQYFWPGNSSSGAPLSPLLDLSILRALFNKSTKSARQHANIVPDLLRSLHVALNEGEYCSDQPTYVQAPLSLGNGKGNEQHEEEAVRKHVDQMRNMGQIQEDSIVKDLFEGMLCLTSRCRGCHETTASFEPFTVLQVPKPTKSLVTLPELLEEFEAPSAPTANRKYCTTCKKYQLCVDSRKIWSLPTVLVCQLPSSSSASAPISASNSPRSAAETLRQFTPGSSHSSTASSRRNHQRRIDTFTPIHAPAAHAPVMSSFIDYPLDGLDMSQYDRDASPRKGEQPQRSSPSPPRSSASSISELDINSESDDTEVSTDASTYDLFAVRERCHVIRTKTATAPSAAKYRAYAKDPMSLDWQVFDGEDVNVVEDLGDLVMPRADLLFYRRRTASS